jgi:hypothetical protein
VLRLLLVELGVALDGHGALAAQAYRAVAQVPTKRRRQLDVTFGHIFQLGRPHARPFLEELAAETWGADALDEVRTWSAIDLAACLCLANPPAFERLADGYVVDSWEYAYEFRAPRPASLRPCSSARAKVAWHVDEHLSTTPYGRRCYVEEFIGPDRLMLAVYHDGETEPVEAMHGGTLQVRWMRPLCRMAATYLVETSTLFVRAARSPDAELLRDIVARVYFDNPGYFANPLTTPRFCFDALLDPERSFSTKGEDQIQHVSLTRVVATCPHRAIYHLTADLRPSTSWSDARTALAAHGIGRGTSRIAGIRLLFVFAGPGRSHRTVHLANPNTSNFDGTARDCLIRRYLLAWGIDVNPTRTVEPPSSLSSPQRQHGD